MKRIATAAVAAATAVSLIAAPAQAAETRASSQVSDLEAGVFLFGKVLKDTANPGTGLSAPFAGSSKSGMFKTDSEKAAANQSDIVKSSFKNDIVNGYKAGTTYDILVGTGIAAAIIALLGGAAASQGLIKLPF